MNLTNPLYFSQSEGNKEHRPSSPKKHKPVFQSTLEECDVSDEEDTVILLLREDGSVVQRVSMGEGGTHIHVVCCAYEHVDRNQWVVQLCGSLLVSNVQ